MVAKMKQPDRTLVAALDPFMTAHGFKYIKSREVYIRKTPLGFDDFSWSSYPLATGEKWEAGYYEGHYGLGLRSDAIEALTSEVLPIHGADNQRYAFTVYRNVGNPDGHWFAFDPARDKGLCLRFDHLDADVVETVGRIEAMLEADGWGWYRRYADPVALSRDINEPMGGADPHLLINNPTNRPLVGIAAACVGEPERVSALIEEWLSVIRGWDEQYADARRPQAESYVTKFKLITDKARELGYVIPV
jgi:hypothetical protein